MPNEETWNLRWLSGDTPWSFNEANDPFYEDFPKIKAELDKNSSSEQKLTALIPLSGSTNAIKYLRDRGFFVTAVEFSDAAIKDIQDNLFPEVDFRTEGNKLSAENLEIYNSDFFEFNSKTKFDLIYDRAAFVAIDKEDREKYVKKLNEFSKPNSLLYLSLFEWDTNDNYGPPFSSPLTLVEKMLESFDKVFSQKTKQDSVSEKMQSANIFYYYYTHSLLKKT